MSLQLGFQVARVEACAYNTGVFEAAAVFGCVEEIPGFADCIERTRVAEVRYQVGLAGADRREGNAAVGRVQVDYDAAGPGDADGVWWGALCGTGKDGGEELGEEEWA